MGFLCPGYFLGGRAAEGSEGFLRAAKPEGKSKLPFTHSSCGSAAITIQHSHANPASYAGLDRFNLCNPYTGNRAKSVNTSPYKFLQVSALEWLFYERCITRLHAFTVQTVQ